MDDKKIVRTYIEKAKLLALIVLLIEQGFDFVVLDDRGGSGAYQVIVRRPDVGTAGDFARSLPTLPKMSWEVSQGTHALLI